MLHIIKLASMITFALSMAIAPRAVQDSPPTKRSGVPSNPAVHSEKITIPNGDSGLEAYLARPKGDAPAPGILLIHEWWGLNDWVRLQADRFAANGYCALAVDLYRGEVAQDRDQAHELMRGLPDERALADMKTALEHLAKHERVAGRPVGVIGWCMGGGYAIRLAIAEPRLACTVVCYGKPVTDPDQLRKIKGPILGIWGAEDRGIDIESFKKALDAAGVKATQYIYPGAGHAFLNENNPRGYNAEQAAKAWSEIDAFLKRELRD